MQNSTVSYSLYECPDQLTEQLENFATDYSTIEKVEPWPMGDHMLFAGVGIPAVAITSTQIYLLDGSGHIHQKITIIRPSALRVETVIFLNNLTTAQMK